MCPPGHAAFLTPKRKGSAEKLQHKPKAEEEKGRDVYDLDNNKKEEKGHHPGIRIEKKIGAHHTGNSTACTHDGKL